MSIPTLYVPFADGPSTDPDRSPRRGWSSDARSAHAAVLAERPGIAGADLSALVQACTMLTTADKLDRLVRRDGYTVPGSKGQPVAHPVLAEARQLRTTAAAILDRLSPVQSRAERRQQAGLNRTGRAGR